MTGVSHKKAPSTREVVSWMTAAATVAQIYRVPLKSVVDCRGRGSRAHQGTGLLEARRAAVYLAVVGANLSTKAAVRASGLHRKTVYHHLRRVEEDRDLKGELDAMLDALADQLAAVLGAAPAARAAA